MFCEKCGTQLPDDAQFCSKCGHKLSENTQNANNTNEVLLEVKPTFKFIYMIFPHLKAPLIIFFVMIIGYIYAFARFSVLFEEPFSLKFLPIIIGGLSIPIILTIIAIIKGLIDKKQYEKCTYIFYEDRIVFKDNFMNVMEREIKYQNIREIAKRQSFMQRLFKIGNIVLFSNAETGFASGILLFNISNVDEVYIKIKEIMQPNNQQNNNSFAEDNQIKLQIKPKYNIHYKLITTIGQFFITLIIVGLYFRLFFIWTKWPITILFTMLIGIIYVVVKMTFGKFQYDDLEYNFYATKIQYKDGFLDKEEKELEYQYIREVYLNQNILEKLCNIGTIRLHTTAANAMYTGNSHNASMSLRNGIYIHCVENVQEQYIKIKQIIDEGMQEKN